MSDNEIAIVVEAIDPPTAHANPEYCEVQDAIIGLRDADGDFVLLRVDLRRYEPHPDFRDV